MQIAAYLNFPGNCREAFEYYQKVLGGQIPMTLTYGQMPGSETGSTETKEWIAHTRLVVGESTIMGSDTPPQYAETPAGFSVCITLDDVVDGERIFNALAESGVVKMPFSETFWAQGFGMLVDRFGTPWTINSGAKSM